MGRLTAQHFIRLFESSNHIHYSVDVQQSIYDIGARGFPRLDTIEVGPYFDYLKAQPQVVVYFNEGTGAYYPLEKHIEWLRSVWGDPPSHWELRPKQYGLLKPNTPEEEYPEIPFLQEIIRDAPTSAELSGGTKSRCLAEIALAVELAGCTDISFSGYVYG